MRIGCFKKVSAIFFLISILTSNYTAADLFKMFSIIQKAFFLEACVNTTGIIALLVYPNESLSSFSVRTSEITPIATLLARVAGMLVLALTPQLLLAAPDSEGCAGKRRFVYITLGTGEGALIPLLLWEAFRATDAEKVLSGGGISKVAGILSATSLVPLLVWRAWVWQARPHWFEQRGEKGKML